MGDVKLFGISSDFTAFQCLLGHQVIKAVDQVPRGLHGLGRGSRWGAPSVYVFHKNMQISLKDGTLAFFSEGGFLQHGLKEVVHCCLLILGQPEPVFSFCAVEQIQVI